MDAATGAVDAATRELKANAPMSTARFDTRGPQPLVIVEALLRALVNMSFVELKKYVIDPAEKTLLNIVMGAMGDIEKALTALGGFAPEVGGVAVGSVLLAVGQGTHVLVPEFIRHMVRSVQALANAFVNIKVVPLVITALGNILPEQLTNAHVSFELNFDGVVDLLVVALEPVLEPLPGELRPMVHGILKDILPMPLNMYFTSAKVQMFKCQERPVTRLEHSPSLRLASLLPCVIAPCSSASPRLRALILVGS
jgi:hypothetical protein